MAGISAGCAASACQVRAVERPIPNRCPASTTQKCRPARRQPLRMSFGTLRGRVDEKHTLMRAFLRQIDFDPELHAGRAYFWVVPNGGQDGLEVRLAGQGRYRGAPASGADADSSILLFMIMTKRAIPASPKKDAPPGSDGLL